MKIATYTWYVAEVQLASESRVRYDFLEMLAEQTIASHRNL